MAVYEEQQRAGREGVGGKVWGATISGVGLQPLALNSLLLKSKDSVEGAHRCH